MGDYAKKKAVGTQLDETKGTATAEPPVEDSKVEQGTGDTEVSFSTQVMTKMGSPEQVRRMLIGKYGPRNVWGTASGRWFVRSTDSQGKFTPWGEASTSDFSPAGVVAGALPMIGGAVGGALAAPAAIATANPMIESAGIALGTGAGEELNKAATEVAMGPRDESLGQHALETATSVGAGFLGAEIPRGVGMAFRAGIAGFEKTGLGSKIMSGLRGATTMAPFKGNADKPLMAAAGEMGIKLTPGEVSKSAPVKQLMSFLRGTIGSSTEFAKLEGPRYQLFTKYVDDFLSTVGHPTQRFKTMGETVMNAVEGLRAQRLGFTDHTTGLKVSGVSDVLFNDAFSIANKSFPVRVLPGNTGQVEALVNMQGVKKDITDLVENLSGTNVAAPKLFKLARTTEDTIGMSEFVDLRADLMQMAKSKQIIGTRANRLATILIGKMDNELKDQATQYGVDKTFLPALAKARDYYSKAAKLFNEGVIAQIAQRSPSDVAQQVVTMNKAEDVRTIKNVLTRMGASQPTKFRGLWEKVQASTIDFAFKMKPGMYGRVGETKMPMIRGNQLKGWWDKMLPEVKQSMFTAEQRRSLDKIVLVGSEIPIGTLPGGWAGRTIALSKSAMIASGLVESVFAGAGFAAGGYPGAMMGGMIGLGSLYYLPKTAAKMALSQEGRALLGEGLQLSKTRLVTKAVSMAKFMTRLGVYLGRPEFQGDMEETRTRVRAGMMLSANGLKTDEENIDAFLAKNPNFK